MSRNGQGFSSRSLMLEFVSKYSGVSCFVLLWLPSVQNQLQIFLALPYIYGMGCYRVMFLLHLLLLSFIVLMLQRGFCLHPLDFLKMENSECLLLSVYWPRGGSKGYSVYPSPGLVWGMPSVLGSQWGAFSAILLLLYVAAKFCHGGSYVWEFSAPLQQ